MAGNLGSWFLTARSARRVDDTLGRRPPSTESQLLTPEKLDAGASGHGSHQGDPRPALQQ